METSLQKELDRTKQDKDKFVSEFSENDYDDIINGWQVDLLTKTVKDSERNCPCMLRSLLLCSSYFSLHQHILSTRYKDDAF